MKNSQGGLTQFPSPSAMIDEQLFSLNIEADELRFFLEQIVRTVNDHSNTINIIQNDLKKRSNQSDIESQFNRIADSISVRDMEFQKLIQFELEKPQPENTGDSLADSANKIINKEAITSQGMRWLYKRTKDWEQKCDQLDEDIKQRIRKDDLRMKVRKTRKKLRKEMGDNQKRINTQVSELDKQVAQQLQLLQQNIGNVEKKTLWKIQDCETLLHKRINSDYVESSCKSVYDKMLKEIQKVKEENFQKLFDDIEELESKVSKLQDNTQDKLRNMKDSLKQFTEQLNNKYVTMERLDYARNGLNERSNEQLLKIQELQKRMDTIAMLEKQIPLIQELEERMYNQENKGEKFVKDMEDLNVKLESLSQFSGGGEGGKSDIDPHKVCQIDADTKRLKIDVQDVENKLRQIDQDTKRKLDQFEQRVINQLAILKSTSEGAQMSKEDILLTVERDIGMPTSMLRTKIIQLLSNSLNIGSYSLEQTLKNMLESIGDLEKKMDGLTDLEKRMNKKVRHNNEQSDLQKQLDQKANNEDFNKEIGNVNDKIKGLSDLLNNLKSNQKLLQEFQEYLQSQLQLNTQETINIITGNSRMITQRCVVCGDKSKIIKDQTDKSQDFGKAKLYRGDIKSTNVYEQTDIFEINSSQISNELTKTMPQKQNVITYKDQHAQNEIQNANQQTLKAPSSNFRPQSASIKKQ